jgi:hypothetical protein
MGLEKPFDLPAQRLIGAAGIVQVRRALRGVFPLQGCFKNDRVRSWYPSGRPSQTRLYSYMRIFQGYSAIDS